MNNEKQRPAIPAREFKRMTRRELLKLAPVLVVGALTLPQFSESLLKTGLSWTDRAAGAFFSPERLAQTFSEHELTPIEVALKQSFAIDLTSIVVSFTALSVGIGFWFAIPGGRYRIRFYPSVRKTDKSRRSNKHR